MTDEQRIKNIKIHKIVGIIGECRHSSCGDCVKDSDVCWDYIHAESLIDEGYRKQSDVAREFAEKLSKKLKEDYLTYESDGTIAVGDNLCYSEVLVAIKEIAAEFGVEE